MHNLFSSVGEHPVCLSSVGKKNQQTSPKRMGRCHIYTKLMENPKAQVLEEQEAKIY